MAGKSTLEKADNATAEDLQAMIDKVNKRLLFTLIFIQVRLDWKT